MSKSTFIHSTKITISYDAKMEIDNYIRSINSPSLRFSNDEILHYFDSIFGFSIQTSRKAISILSSRYLDHRLTETRQAGDAIIDLAHELLAYVEGITANEVIRLRGENLLDAINTELENAKQIIAAEGEVQVSLFATSPRSSMIPLLDTSASARNPPSSQPNRVKLLTPARGRPKGTGFLAADEALLPKLKALIQNDASLTPTRAAWALLPHIAGNGSESSKVTRLVRRYKETEKNGF